MKIETVKVGFLKANCHLLEKDGKPLLIDPGDEVSKIRKSIGTREVIGVLLTHRHSDHIGALSSFQDLPVYEYQNLEEKEYQVGPFSFEVIFTPGHSQDSVTYYFSMDQVMFTGDFLFHEDIGRMDLKGGSRDEMRNSLSKIRSFDPHILVFPGHDQSTTLGHEFEMNPAFYEF